MTGINLKIAASESAMKYIQSAREKISVANISAVCDVAAVVFSSNDVWSERDVIAASDNNIPLFCIVPQGEMQIWERKYPSMVFYGQETIESSDFCEKLCAHADAYEKGIVPPFLRSLIDYVSNQNTTFSCPGHQGTEFFKKHPAGQVFLDFFGENILRSDAPHADPVLGEILTHGGPPGEAQRHAAGVFKSDKTYFVLNGTSTANKIVTSALITPGDLVLFDRNNHKSCYHGALLQAGGTPIYLETTRNAIGMIGGIPAHCYEENYLRAKVAEVDPRRAEEPRPFRLAILQFGTCDGIVPDARRIIEKISHLCEYILFDSAWLGYEQFVSLMKDLSPLNCILHETDSGIFVTQSVHKQLAGFSQASQIHKKDSHAKNQSRYCSHKRFNHAFMMHSSTSPFYPIFSSLDVNAKIHSNGWGERLWERCIEEGVEARKAIFSACSYIRPFVPDLVDGRLWQDHSTELILRDRKFFNLSPSSSWHGFEGYAENQYILDPGKLILCTSANPIKIDGREIPGIPASILAHYLRRNGLIPEKNELQLILFLLTPAITKEKIDRLVQGLVEFECHIKNNSTLATVFPGDSFGKAEDEKDTTLLELFERVYSIYRKHSIETSLREMFMERNLPKAAMLPMQANFHLVKGEVDFIPVREAEGRIAAEGALPYPPGMLCIAPGERWSGHVLDYFIAIEELINEAPIFSPGMQGVYQEQESSGQARLFCHVVKEK